MRRLSVLVLAAACLQLAAAGVQAATYKPQTVMIATSNPANSQHDIAIQAIKKVLEEESNGAISVKVFLNGTMGDEQSNVKQLRTGELQIATFFTGNAAPFAPILNLMNLPYLFPNPKDAATLLTNKEFVKKLSDAVAAQSQMRPLGWILGGYRHITNAKHRITKMSDLQGLKLRVSPAPTQLEAFRAWGIEPHPMAWSEVFNALQQGVVDGQENPFFTIRDNKFWEVQKYVTELHYILWIGIIGVSNPWYQRLDPDTRALLDKAVAIGQETEWKWVADQEDICKKLAIEHAMTVDQLEDEPLWIEKARAIWPKFYDLIGDRALIDQALAIIKAG